MNNANVISSEDETTPIVEDPIFASVLNQHGLLQVDSIVVKVTRDYVFMAELNNLEKLLNDDYLASLTSTEKVLTKKAVTLSNFGTDDDVWSIEIDRNNEIDPSGDPGSGVSTMTRLWSEQYTSNPARKGTGEIWNTW